MNQHQFETDVQSGEFYAVKLNECINALESIMMAAKFEDVSQQSERLKEWGRYHLKRLMNNFDINWSPTIRDFL